MLPNASPETSDNVALAAWRQGDYALDVGGFLFARASAGDDRFDPDETIEGIIGLIAVSQTCDIIRRTGDRHWMTVCPLVQVSEEEASSASKGLKPYLTPVPNAGPSVFASLNRVMSVHKDLVETWERKEGFSTETERVAFAAALERKFGQFAFPDKFDQAVKPLRNAIIKKHRNISSPQNSIYKSIMQIRFKAEPDWSADHKEITVIAILEPVSTTTASPGEVRRALHSLVQRISLPAGYAWSGEMLIAAYAEDLTAGDVISSRRADFDFLCY